MLYNLKKVGSFLVLFKLKMHCAYGQAQVEPDADTAAAVGTEGDSTIQADAVQQTAAEVFIIFGIICINFPLFCQEMLSRIPGISRHNINTVINNYENMHQLSRAGEKKLAGLIGPVCAKRVRNFFRKTGGTM
jgi:hypothetical protein